MRRTVILSLTTVIILVTASLVVPGVFAKGKQGGHFIDHTLAWRSGSLIGEGVVAGAANGELLVTMDAWGVAHAMCETRGGTQAPGRNPIRVEVHASATVTTDQNGRAAFEVEADDPAMAISPNPKEAGCPNGNWKVISLWTDWQAAMLRLFSTDGVLLDSASFTCDTTFGDPITVVCTRN